MDFALFNNHLYGSFDYYNKKSTDVLGTVNMAGVNGTTYGTFNNAAIQNHGIEVTLLGKKVQVSEEKFGEDLITRRIRITKPGMSMKANRARYIKTPGTIGMTLGMVMHW